MKYRKVLNVHCVSPLDKEISEMKKQIQKDIGSNTNIPKIILIGNTGSGKSSLSCALADLSLTIVEGAGRKLILRGNGVMAGGQSFTKQPQLLLDQQHRFILCDCPGFSDTSGTEQEIKNSFIIDYLFQSDPNEQNRFKVLLVASAAEIASSRGQIIADSINRAIEMLQNPSQLEQGLGLVITKTDPERNAQDYFEELQENPTQEMMEWCQYFSKHIDRIFVMPVPSRSERNQQYTFPEKGRLLNFLENNYMINPEHKITLSESARSQMENLQIVHMSIVSDIIRQLFEKITLKFKNEDQSINLEKWLSTMKTMIERRIDNRNSLNEFINNKIPNIGEFAPFIDELEHYENFDTFINRALNTPCISTSIQKAITTCLFNAIEELKTLLKYTKQLEEQIRKQRENERTIEEQRENSTKLLQQIDEQNKFLAEARKDRDRLLGQLDEMQNQLIEQNKQLAKMKRDKMIGDIVNGIFKGIGAIVGICESISSGNPMPAVAGIVNVFKE